MPATSQSAAADLGGQPTTELLTVVQVAGILGVSPRTVRRLKASGQLRGASVTGRIPRSAVSDYLATTSAGPAVAPAGPAERNEQ
jgi:excisionase family DNA binding protein